MKKHSSTGKRIMFLVLCALVAIMFTGAIVFSIIYFSANLDENAIIVKKATLKIVDSTGTEIDAAALNRYVKYEDISVNITNAFVALEDKRFFTHKGVDYYRLVGATIKNIRYGYLKEGGSTITQQLAKNTQLNSEKTLTRKIKELKLASDIEKNYTKEEILEMYLNAIYYGNGIYGIDSACKNYFNKSPAEATVAESAILAGIVKNPSKYSPISNKSNALDRMKLVLRLMREQGYIDENEYKTAIDYEYEKPSVCDSSPYFAAALQEACRLTGMTEKELIKSGHTIECYCKPQTQAMLEQIAKLEDFRAYTIGGKEALCAAIVCDNENGGIIACYASDGIAPTEFRRSPGSAIKPIAVYAPAIEKGEITEATIFSDKQTDHNGYCPSNYKNIYYGDVDVETAVKKSINTVAVNIFETTGVEYCINKTIEAGITVDKNDKNLSFALGGMTYGATTTELCSAYMTLANGGKSQTVRLIKKIVDKNGKTVYANKSSQKRVFSEETSCIMTDLLQKTAQTGTAKKLTRSDIDIAAKTGTASGGQYNTDAWCLSFCPDYTICVWYGGADNSDQENITETGGGLPALLSANIYNNLPIKNCRFALSDNVAEIDIDSYAVKLTGKLYRANEYTPQEYKKSYLFGESNLPKDTSPFFSTDGINFSATNVDNGVELSFGKMYPNQYKITRTDLSDGTVTEIYSTNSAQTEAILTKEIYADETVLPARIYLYNLEIGFGQGITASQSVTIIT